MSKVNYIRECRAFTMLAAEERLSANEVVIWHALFELFNLKSEGENWPDGFIPISNARLLALTTFGSGDSGCETLRKARERLQSHGLIKYRKGRRGALMPEYCLCYFFAEKSEPDESVKIPVIDRPQGIISGNRTDKLLGRPLGNLLGKPLGKPLGNPLGKPLGKPLDIPLNVNLNVNPNPGHTQFLTGRANPPRAGQRRACPVGDTASRQPNDARSTPTEQVAGKESGYAELRGQRRARLVSDTASRQPNDARSTPTEQGAGKGYDYAELRRQINASGYDLGWKTSARARGAVAQRLLDKYEGQLDTKDAWGDLCEVMAEGLDPGTIEQALPTRPFFSLLIARLRTLALCREHSPPARGTQGAARACP